MSLYESLTSSECLTLSTQVYTISLLLLCLTWSPFYLAGMVQVATQHLATSLTLSPLVNTLATLYAPLAALLHGYRRAVGQLKYFQSNIFNRNQLKL